MKDRKELREALHKVRNKYAKIVDIKLIAKDDKPIMFQADFIDSIPIDKQDVLSINYLIIILCTILEDMIDDIDKEGLDLLKTNIEMLQMIVGDNK